MLSARAGDLEAACVYVESGRARLLAEAQEATRADLARLADSEFAEDYQNYVDASQKVQDLRAELQQALQPATGDGVRSHAIVRRELESAQTGLQAAIAAIQTIDGYEDFFAVPTFAAICQAVTPDIPLVYLIATPDGGLAMIVNEQGNVKDVWLDHLTDERLREEIVGPDGDSALGGYLGAYDRWRRDAGNGAKTRTWFDAIERTTGWLWEAAMAQLVRELQGLGFEQAVLIPGGWLGLLPLHAAWTPDENTPTGKRYALDDILFSYAPSARALRRARETAGKGSCGRHPGGG